jgi:acyl-lipid omega-6 desaturase (Delta-12 desaturase)
MKTGVDLILATKDYAKDSTLRSWWYVLSTGFLLIGAVIGTQWNVHLVGQLLCSLLAGLLILRFFVIYHDQQHHAILPRSHVAEALMRVFGIYALSASSIWRSSHNHHHNHNSKLRGSHIGSFPIMTASQFRKSGKAARRNYLLMRHPATILLGYFTSFLFGMCLNPFLTNPRRHWDCAVALLVHVAIGVALFVYSGWQGVLLTQTVPHLIAYAFGTYLFYAQHNFPGVSFNEKGGWTYEKAALESSSYLRTGRVMEWFTANIGYHHVHHLNARIPFYRLPEVMRALPELQSPRTTSLHPREIWRCLRLKVWDVPTQRMVALTEMTARVKKPPREEVAPPNRATMDPAIDDPVAERDTEACPSLQPK